MSRRQGNTSVRSVNYATSPLLASKTPPWRSRFVVALVGLAFLVLLGRAVFIQIIGTDFYQKEGEKRYAHQLELQASRGRILDRNGLVLATSVPAPSVWVIPKDFQADVSERKALAKKLGMTAAELQDKLDGSKNFAWLRRQVDDALWADVKAMGLKGVYQVREYRRRYPEGEAAAHVVGFTNVEDNGQEGVELRFQKELQGQDGQRMVVRDRLGRVIEDIGDARSTRSTAATSSCPSTRRCSSSPTSACATRCWSTAPRAAARWCWTRRPARCWPWPTTPATTPRCAATSAAANSCATAR